MYTYIYIYIYIYTQHSFAIHVHLQSTHFLNLILHMPPHMRPAHAWEKMGWIYKIKNLSWRQSWKYVVFLIILPLLSPKTLTPHAHGAHPPFHPPFPELYVPLPQPCHGNASSNTCHPLADPCHPPFLPPLPTHKMPTNL